MKSIYFESDDILQIRVSEKQIVREVSQDWHTKKELRKNWEKELGSDPN